jgi:hypothetical protein
MSTVFLALNSNCDLCSVRGAAIVANQFSNSIFEVKIFWLVGLNNAYVYIIICTNKYRSFLIKLCTFVVRLNWFKFFSKFVSTFYIKS